jgi:DNA-binding LacI/PurR family transcriptional regulator
MARVNLEEIGRLAGVSRSTVSRVVNGSPKVSPEAKRRVEEVIAETGYRPHAAARSLASNRTGVFGLVIPNTVKTLFDDPYFGRLILGITGATNAMGTTLALFLFEEQADEQSIIPRVVNPGLVDGVIVTATQIGDPLVERLFRARMPFVVVGRPDDDRCRYSVDADNRGGARTAALHLADLGRIRPALIMPPSNTTAGIDRRVGFLDGLAERGLDIGDRLREGDWTEDSGRWAMNDLLSDRPDSVFVGSDRMAVGALRAINEAGLHCPDDIALVSFDGILSPDQTMPRLTSVAQPVSEVGERAAELLSSIIDGTATEAENVVFPTTLVVRESCGAPGHDQH